MREFQKAPGVREKLGERVDVEHSSAHIGRWQGDRVRYKGERKDLFDLRRCTVVHNLRVTARMPEERQDVLTA